MSYNFLNIAATPDVRAVQAEMGTVGMWPEPGKVVEPSALGPHEKDFISERDSFYMATVSETGWPYVQHRGGPKGFLHVLDDETLAFADFRGNLQYITAGNLRGSDRACLFLMDYTRRRRLKIYATVSLAGADESLALKEKWAAENYRAVTERIYLLKVVAFDWNCPQHIVPRYTFEQLKAHIEPVMKRLEELEAENAALKQRLQE
jgi:uncharacterized protein